MYDVLVTTELPVYAKGLSAIAKTVLNNEVCVYSVDSFAEMEVVLIMEKIDLLFLDLRVLQSNGWKNCESY